MRVCYDNWWDRNVSIVRHTIKSGTDVDFVFILSVERLELELILTTLIGWQSTSSPGERPRERDYFKSIVDHKNLHLIVL